MRQRLFSRFTVFIAAVALSLSSGIAHAQLPPGCKEWIKKIDGLMNLNTADGQQAAKWVSDFVKTQDPVVARGMLKFAINKDVKAAAEYFNRLTAEQNPFSSAEEVYRALGKFTRDDYEDRLDGVKSLIGNLAAETPSNEKGALGELFVGAKLLDEGKPILGFQVPTGARRYDVVVADVAAIPHNLSGFSHEVKNWTSRLVAGDSRLSQLAGEFAEDIALHRSSGFQFLQFDFRSAVQDQKDLIRDRLLEVISEQFENDPQTASQVAGAFLQRWNSGTMVSFF